MESLKDKLAKGEVGIYTAIIELIGKIEELSKKVSSLESKLKSVEKSTTPKKKAKNE